MVIWNLLGLLNVLTVQWYTSIDVEGPQVRSCVEIAKKCVAFDHHKRPTIAEIMQELDEMDNS
jgi:hypothetical protein